VKTRDEQSVLL